MKSFFRKLALTSLLLLAGLPSFAVTPAMPYPSLSSGDVLTTTWLMGTFNTLYNWAQTTNASMTPLFAGVSPVYPVTASLTTSIATTTATLLFDTTGLKYQAMSASGAMAIEAIVIGQATGTADVAQFLFNATLMSASGTNGFLGDVDTTIRRNGAAISGDWVATMTNPTGGRFSIIASSPAGVVWKAKITTLESNY